ncbi:MAG: XdhC family protein [Ginsengibacter sp.]
MKEIISIVNAWRKTDFLKMKAALATVVRVDGSSYRRTGARMLVLDNGVYFGGISGGCLEGDALRKAQKAIFKNKPSIITYDTTQEDGQQVGIGLGCNGIIDILITPLDKSDDDPVYLLSLISETREPRVLISIVECEENKGLLGKTILFKNEKQFLESFPIKDISLKALKDIQVALKNETSETVAYNAAEGTMKIFIEIIIPAIHLIIYGSNYDILPTATIGKELGWNVTVVTNIAKANKLLLEKATNIIDNKSGLQPWIDNYSAIVLMAHDYKTDINNLQQALTTTVPYIGLLGPRKRSEKMFDELNKQNIIISEQDMERIYAPCGLDIGAINPEEIALSIAAEIRACFAGRKGMPLKYRPGNIYSD